MTDSIKEETTALVDTLRKGLRIVELADGSYGVCCVARMEGDRFLLLNESPLELRASDISDLYALIERVAGCADESVLWHGSLLSLDDWSGKRWVIQDYADYIDYPRWTDRSEDGQLVGFETKEEAESYLAAEAETSYQKRLSVWRDRKEKADRQREVYEARKAALVAAGLWESDVLSDSWFAAGAEPELGGEKTRVVALEESDWYRDLC